MKRWFLLFASLPILGGIVYAAPDTIYNSKGQAVQIYAPNQFQAVTTTKTAISLSNVLEFAMDSVNNCIVYLKSIGTTAAGDVSMTVYSGTPATYGRGYGISYAIYSGCSGKFSSMRGDWSGQ